MKFLFFVLLSVSSIANAAQWSALGENDFGAFYVDKATIAPVQGLIQVDTLLNWVEPHPLPGNDAKTYMSEVALAYLDCKNSELAFGSRKLYEDADGMGHVVFSIALALGDVRLRAFSAGSTGEQLMKAVCPKPSAAAR
ncbi:hypothetical protein D9O50_02125 [Oxalobacteraceae bacterium CAVE-383]|nr:hypothetical protein D9O50_02125 [Oxalobacteraceae bacterium CAVE-383]